MSERSDWLAALEKALGAPVAVATIHGGEQVVEVPVERLLVAVEAFREAYPKLHLSAITGRPVGDDVELLYHFYPGQGVTLRVRCETQEAPSLTPSLPAANWYEREIHDLLGIVFTGHPHLDPLLLSRDWDGPPPLRPERNSS